MALYLVINIFQYIYIFYLNWPYFSFCCFGKRKRKWRDQVFVVVDPVFDLDDQGFDLDDWVLNFDDRVFEW